MKYILLLLLIPFYSISQDKIMLETYLTGDNSYQQSIKQYIGYDKNIIIHSKDTTKPDKVLDVTPMMGYRYYYYDKVDNTFSDFRVNLKYKHNKNVLVNINTSILNSKDWNPIFFDGFIRYNKGRYSVESYIENESVGTPKTNQLRYYSKSIGTSLDFKISKKFTIVNSITYNKISDGNDRWFQTSRLIYTINQKSYLDLKFKHMLGSDWSPYYFSPESITQYNIGYGLYKPIFKDKAIIKFYFGSGFQLINKDKMLMLNSDLKLSRTFNRKWYGEVSISSRNFNDYIYNTMNIKLAYNL